MERAIIWLLFLAGLSMVAGWATCFRNRHYLGLLGAALLSLAAASVAAQRLQTARDFGLPAPPQVNTALRLLVVLAGALFLAAVVAAVQEVRRRLAEIRESYRAAEEALLEIARASARRRPDQDQPHPPQDSES